MLTLTRERRMSLEERIDPIRGRHEVERRKMIATRLKLLRKAWPDCRRAILFAHRQGNHFWHIDNEYLKEMGS